jgi:thiol-disulfide isomerase/thioredoxin
MNKTTLLSFLFLLAQIILPAQIKLRGTLVNQPAYKTNSMFTIEYWSVDHWQQGGGGNVKADFTFQTTLPTATPGQYRLRMFGENKVWADFIVPDSSMADSILVFALDYTQLNGGPARIIGSKANELYYELMDAYRQRMLPDAPETAIKELNRRCVEVVAHHRKTLVGDIALLLYEPQKGDYAGNAAIEKMTANEFAKAHALEKIPFEHEDIMYHTAFFKAVVRYYNYFEHTESGDNAFVDGLMARRNGNDAIDGFLFRFALDQLMDFKNDPSLSYLLKWYVPDCPNDNPQPNYIQNLLKALKVCAPGNLAPDLNFSNPEGKAVNLGTVCAQNKLTIMLFWRSTCTHCKEFEPKLVEIYNKYHPLGIEVYALSLDREAAKWREDLQSHPTPWINVYVPAEQGNEIARLFPTPSTPTLIALDKDRHVVSRVLSRINLEAYLDGELAKRK